MNLTEQFDNARSVADKLIEERKELIGAKLQIEKALADNDHAGRKAIRNCDSLYSALSIVPAKSRILKGDELRKKRRAIFAKIQKIPNVWIMPFGIALMSEVNSNDVCSILRRAAEMDEIPVEHNGKCGRASKYRWVTNN